MIFYSPELDEIDICEWPSRLWWLNNISIDWTFVGYL